MNLRTFGWRCDAWQLGLGRLQSLRFIGVQFEEWFSLVAESGESLFGCLPLVQKLWCGLGEAEMGVLHFSATLCNFDLWCQAVFEVTTFSLRTEVV